jgi:hydroxymethylpyrimidine pyrophosphatase-like HAD family hydrolase
VSIRALAFDLDGTLLGPDERVSERNVAAVRAARAEGFDVIVATARWYQLAEQAACELDPEGLDIDGPVIACSGAQVRRLRDGIDLLDLRLPGEFVEVLFRICDSNRCVAWAALDDHVVVKMDGTPTSLPPGLRQASSLGVGAEGTQPRMVLVQGRDVCALIDRELRDEFANAVRFVESISSAGKRLLTLTATGADKGAALAIACADLGIEPHEVVAFGDADNDIEMFRVAGLSVAMGQASPAVKAAASSVTAEHTADGVALAVERFLRDGESALRS